MGNVLETKMSCERPVAVVQPMPAEEPASPRDEAEACPRANVTLQLFNYRQQMALKDHQVVKWATSKLLLTEELLKQQDLPQQQQQQQQQQQHKKQLDMPDLSIDEDDDAAWAERQLAMLTDDEDDVENAENLSPMDQGLDIELNHLIKYRLKLRNTIVEVAQEKMRKREKTKLKRLKRRTLISSKKPSNKDKHRRSY
ncbi:PREDICTED: probable serine/threonine-protein kinase kinX [Drosophila arizonae]|uniref:Probable serine/threonine-protein kinase kinX n=1 Tax=Drosophila arizonae TaxID=7263 RepID=A0ABM1NQ80_DROAR|nr:PREDICTED: probable serine/threonine-protein kinase kinX [Drosophila arizonae]